MFEFIKNGQLITDNRIQWKFPNLDEIFRSDEARLERNIQFFKNKYKIGADVEVEFINVKKIEEDVKPIIADTSTEPIAVVDHSVTTEEPVVPQAVKDTVDTPKRKPRKKTPKL